jgi:5-enolpyruvylshikimate-3-phosphate synthase
MGRICLYADCLAEGPLVEQLFQRDLLPADDLAADVDNASQGVPALNIQGSKPTDKSNLKFEVSSGQFMSVLVSSGIHCKAWVL